MMAFGIALALATAFMQSLCYVLSGSYVRRTGNPGWSLVVPQQAIMLPFAAAGVFVFFPVGMSDDAWRTVVCWTLLCTLTGYLGNIGLFQMQRYVEPSRTAPLQSLKVPFIAVFAFLLTGKAITLVQASSLLLVIVASHLLGGSGKRIPAVAWGWLLTGVSGYAVSDVAIGQMLVATAPFSEGLVECSLFAISLGLLSTGAVGVMLIYPQSRTRAGLPRAADWFRYAVPYSLVWLAAVAALTVSFSMVGVVTATMVQSLRAVISVALGWFLARHSFSDIEDSVPKALFIKRIVAASLTVLAVWLYCSGGAHTAASGSSSGRSSISEKCAVDRVLNKQEGDR